MTSISVHGRFQPFHRGHLEYLTAACLTSGANELVVGITQFQTAQLRKVTDEAAAHRTEPLANELSFHERATMIDIALAESDLNLERWRVIPFPIETPSELQEFLPLDVPIYTTTYDSWNEKKIRDLEGLGYRVHNLWTRDEKVYQGTDLRRRMIAGEESWRSLVTPAVEEYLDLIQVPERLRLAAKAVEGAGLALQPESADK